MIPRILYFLPLHFSHYRNVWICKYLTLSFFFQNLEYLHMQHKIFLRSKYKSFVHFTSTYTKKLKVILCIKWSFIEFCICGKIFIWKLLHFKALVTLDFHMRDIFSFVKSMALWSPRWSEPVWITDGTSVWLHQDAPQYANRHKTDC